VKNTHNIVVIAHDKKKQELMDFLVEREDWLWSRNLIATGRTAEYLEQREFKVPLIHKSPARYGGYNQITEMIINGEVAMVIFFMDLNVQLPYHPDIEQLLKTVDDNNIPLATNSASAELMIIGLIRMELAMEESS
jgi:methylglyoxal synthase